MSEYDLNMIDLVLTHLAHLRGLQICALSSLHLNHILHGTFFCDDNHLQSFLPLIYGNIFCIVGHNTETKISISQNNKSKAKRKLANSVLMLKL